MNEQTDGTKPAGTKSDVRGVARPGIKTTEFWLALAVVVGGAVGSVYAESEWAKVIGVVSAALAAAGYGFSRAMVKSS